jgi:hypothetical protein
MEIVTQFFSWVLNLLPKSPFQSYIQQIGNIPYLAELNWFVPVPQLIAIGTAWLAAISGYYLYSIILRWIRAIQ